jgi:hypothetical protein
MEKLRRIVAMGTFGLAVGLAAGGGGCSYIQNRGAMSWNLQPTDKLPAAQGKVMVSKPDGANRQVTVSVEHLAPPEQAFGKSTYVVWIRPHGGGEAQNMGVLRSDDDLEASLSFKTAFKTFDVMVSAEEQPNVTSPSNDWAFQASVAVPA